MTKISFVGDIMCEEEQLLANKTSTFFDFSAVFKPIKLAFTDSDYVVGNLETPLADEDLTYTNHKWSFNSPIEFAQAVKNLGVNLVSTANNHCLDRGIQGLYRTIENLDKINLDHTGTFFPNEKKEKVFIKKIGKIKVAFISYTYGTNASFNNVYLKNNEKHTINLFKPQEKKILKTQITKRILSKTENIILEGFTFNRRLIKLKKEIKLAKQKADFVFILMHSGGQYNIQPDSWTIDLMNFLFKADVNGVIGCHPHVVQKISINEKNQIGAYSLGNFCSYPGSASCKMNQSEYSIILHIYIDETSKKFEKATFQIAKSTIDKDGKAKIHLLYDLIKQEKSKNAKENLIKDNLLLINRFLNTKYEIFDIKKEYILPKVVNA